MKAKLTADEQALLRSYEEGEFKRVKNMGGEIKRYETYAKGTLKKNKRVNIRVSEYDLKAIQLRAMEEGVPYQTFISSLLHKVADGRIDPRLPNP